ncbi:MAG TPA: hypothetical protein VGN14_11680, partial [Candidatus Elarobacter sp.]
MSLLAYFTQAQAGSALFLGQPGAGTGYVAAVFPEVPPQATYEIADVLGTTPTGAKLNASIVFLQTPIGSDAPSQTAFVNAVNALAGLQPPPHRVIAWSVAPDLANARVATLGAGGDTVMMGALQLYDSSSPVNLAISGQQPLQMDDKGLSIQIVTWSAPPSFTNLAAVAYEPLTIPFTGPNAFSVQLNVSLAQTGLDARGLGFAFGIPTQPPIGTGNAPQLLLYAPLMTPDGTQTPFFTATFDPLDLTNANHPDRTALSFWGMNVDQTTTTFDSCYTSPSGVPVTLTPIGPKNAVAGDDSANFARLIFVNLNYSDNTPALFMLVPEGDFALSVPSGPPQLMCGLQGMEYLTFAAPSGKVSGDRLRFVSGAASYAPVFPFPLASATAAPFDPTAPPLDETWTTAYATLRAPGSGSPAAAQFVAQPPGFQLFGQGGTIDPKAHPKLLGSMAPGRQIGPNPAHPFPLVPYQRVGAAGNPTTIDEALTIAFEAAVLAPLRKAAITQDLLPAPAASTVSFVTPSGYVVEANYDQDPTSPTFGAATWTKIILGTIGSQQIAFDDPDPELIGAFGSGSLMLVIANATNTGHFENTLTIGDWTMRATLADPKDDTTWATFGDYRDIVIVKGTPGRLSDLVANPANWTDPATFAAPVTNGTADISQLVNLSQWLQDYVAQAAAVTGPDAAYFAEFNALVQDPVWTGVLILRADITGIPQDIAGIVAGITDFSHFNAHHLAIPLVPAAIPIAPQPSPVSGLIYYNPFPSSPPDEAVPTDPLVPYGFQLNSLKVTFENSTVQTFSSYAQITLRAMLGSTVDKSSAGFDAVVLTGTYQMIAGQPVYSMASASLTTFTLSCTVLPEVDVMGVQMATVSADPNGNTVSAFSIAGFLNFAVLPGPVTDPAGGNVDLFSFGSAEPGVAAGLSFQNLVLTMTFPTPPQGSEPSSPVPSTFDLASNALRFDLGTSTVRDGSLVAELSLQLTDLLQMTPAPPATPSTPAQLGYLPVIAMIPGGDITSGWNGLAFNVDMGTPGQLAAKAGLTASLVLAWNPTSTASDPWDVQIGLRLPGTAQGAPLISLQTVLSLSIGQVSLQYVQ